jgi:L-threonine-O-3-phosphate decarboxylase
VSSYPDPTYLTLREALGRWHGVEPDWILPGNGAAELLTWAARDLCQCEQVGLLQPGFGDYQRALRAFGTTTTSLPLRLVPPAALGDNPLVNLGDYVPDLPAFLSSQVGLLLTNPHNPTGWLWSRQSLEPLLQQCQLLILDEAFMDFLPPDQQQSLVRHVQDYKNLVILRSLTKFYSLAGLRLGYAIAHPQHLERWQQWRDPWTVNSLAAAVGTILPTDRAFQEQTWAWLPIARQELAEGMQALPGMQPYPSAANFLLIRCNRLPVPQLQQALLRQFRIYIRDCLSFSGLGDRFFRIAVRGSADNQRLLAALAHLLDSD